MNHKQGEPEAMESSSSEEEEEEAKGEDPGSGEEDSASESSSDGDEFDSSDERVNMVPNETPAEPFAQEESSEESSSDEEEEPMKLAEPEKVQNIKSFESDVDSEYETESGSESEGMTQKTVVKESSNEADEDLPLTQKKAKKNSASVNKGIREDDHSAKKGKTNGLKQSQNPKATKMKEEAFPMALKGQGAVAKQTLKDTELSLSVKDEKKAGLSVKKRKLEPSRHDVEADSDNSTPIPKRRKDVECIEKGKMNGERDPLNDTGKEIAKKTLSDPSAILNGSRNVSNKVSAVEREPRQRKKTNIGASNGPSSPQKQKKLPHVWSTDEEIMMASEVLNHSRTGMEVPSKKSDDFWLVLSEVLHEKLSVEFSRDQLSDKLRRMKGRYQSAVQKIKETEDLQKPYKHKNAKEQNLFDIWSQIWGRAEVSTLEDHLTGSDSKTEPRKSIVVSSSFATEGKDPVIAPKMKPASKEKASQERAMAAMEDSAGRDALPPLEGVVTFPMELDKPEAAKEGSSAPEESASLSKDMHKFLQEKVLKSVNELQNWSKNSMESWMTKALALIESSVKTIGDQARHVNMAGITGGSLPMGLCGSMDLQFLHGEQAFQQQWYELQLQELNIYSQRLELMQKECKLKKDQLKLQLQVERRK